MIYTLQPYQENAVAECFNDLSYHILQDSEKPYVAILQAIMGSGKTVMAASLIERLLTSDAVEGREEHELCVIWLSRGSGGLHMQSGDKLKMLLADAPAISVTSVESTSDFVAQRFADNEVYVINWEKVNNSKNSKVENELMVESERPNLISAHKNSTGVKFVFIVDECHQNWETPAYNRLVELFRPTVVLGMSATPTDRQLLSANKRVPVLVAKVIESGMIRDSVYFNTTTDMTENTAYASSEQFFLAAALAKRAELEKMYRVCGSNVTPLLLIQFDDDVSNDNVIEVRDWLETVFADQVEDKYAVWLTDNTSAKQKLRSPNDVIRNLDTNDVRVLLFKVAAATGWDCPRAQVLLRYRKVVKRKSGKGCPFDVQTLGRILRTSEQHAYDNEALNAAYVYVPEENIALEQVFESTYGGASGVKTKKGSAPRTSGSALGEAAKQQFMDTNPQANKTVPVTSFNVDDESETSNDESEVTCQRLDGEFFEHVVRNIEAALKGLNVEKHVEYPTTSDVTQKMRELIDHADLRGLTEEVSREIRFTTHTLAVTDKLIDGKVSTDVENKETSLIGRIGPSDALRQASRKFKDIIGNKFVFDDNVKSNFEKYVYAKFEAMSGLDDETKAHIWAAHAIMYADDGHNLSELRHVVDDLEKWQKSVRRNVFKPTDFVFPSLVVGPNMTEHSKAYPGTNAVRLDSANEIAFVNILESVNNDNVLFWYKNPDHGGNSLCVAYGSDAKHATYPDFIVAFVDSGVGIYEIKDATSNMGFDADIREKDAAIKQLLKNMQAQAPKGVVVYGGVLHISSGENPYIVERPEELSV